MSDLAQAEANLLVVEASAAVSSLGETVTIEGTVVAVFTSSRGNTFVNFGAAHHYVSYAPLYHDLLNLAGRPVRLRATHILGELSRIYRLRSVTGEHHSYPEL